MNNSTRPRNGGWPWQKTPTVLDYSFLTFEIAGKFLPITIFFSLLLTACGPVTPPEQQSKNSKVYSTANGKSASLQRTPGQPLYFVDWLGDVEAPQGKPQPIRISRKPQFSISGFAVDEQQMKVAGGVDVAVDGIPYEAIFGSERPDVAQYFKTPGFKGSGFKVSIPGEEITPGRHTVTIRVFSNDGKTYWEGSPYSIDME